MRWFVSIFREFVVGVCCYSISLPKECLPHMIFFRVLAYLDCHSVRMDCMVQFLGIMAVSAGVH